MVGIVSGLILVLLAVVALALQRLYSVVPVHELKRLARRGDPLAKTLYRPAAYGSSIRLFLWLVIAGALPLGFLLAMPQLPAVVSFGALGVLVIVMLVWVPSMRLTVRSAQFASFFSPVMVGVMSRVHTPLKYIAEYINKYRDNMPHSLLYEKKDLIRLLDLQKEQIDNRIQKSELELVAKALIFGDRQASDVLQPRKEMQVVNADDHLGPVLLDQLHKSRQSAFLVYKDKKENVIGSLSLRDAISAKQDVRVFDLIRHDLIYVHEDSTLRQVMDAFQCTGQQVAVVINRFEEFLGIITLEKLIQELMGEPQAVSMSYEDRSAIASYIPSDKESQEPEKEQQDTLPSPTDEDTSSLEITEVVK
ncbi:MAG TPA: CBS domain-containing protein [Candidatus Saccharimonadales bacterium]|nr:CBS domain-containing protein [Candidatus Saccharimonadales bacterium]